MSVHSLLNMLYRKSNTSSLVLGCLAANAIAVCVLVIESGVAAVAAQEQSLAQEADPSLFSVPPTQDTNRPAWFVGSFQIGGQWLALRSLGEAGLTNPPAWPAMHSFSEAWFVPSAQEEGVGSLFMVLDRRILTNDLLMELTLLDKAGSSLYVDLLATNFVTVCTNICGNLIEGSNEVVCVEVPIALSANPAASIVRLWRGKGEVLVYEAALAESAVQVSDAGQSEQTAAQETVENTGGASSAAADTRGTTSLGAEAGAVAGTGSATNTTAVCTNGTPAFPRPRTTQPDIVYVSQKSGNDVLPGTALTQCGANGPKKTIRAGLDAVGPGGTLVIMDGVYAENLNMSGQDVCVRIVGCVHLVDKPRGASECDGAGVHVPPFADSDANAVTGVTETAREP